LKWWNLSTFCHRTLFHCFPKIETSRIGERSDLPCIEMKRKIQPFIRSFSIITTTNIRSGPLIVRTLWVGEMQEKVGLSLNVFGDAQRDGTSGGLRRSPSLISIP
jgi:hypothetical protein